MPIPDYQTLMRPVLRKAAEGEVRISDVIEELGNELSLSDDEREELIPSGRQTVFANRVHWAKTYLKQAGLVEITKRAHFQITDRGLEALENQEPINNEFLKKFPEFLEFKSRKSSTEGEAQVGPGHSDGVEDTRTPDEIMRAAHQEIEIELRKELLDRVRSASPTFFELLLVQLLVAMGYGGSVGNAGRALGKSGDGGVDGVIDQDALGLDRVYVQAKRYADGNPVGAGAIRDFFGSLDRFKAAKDLLVTTSAFTKDARDTAGMLSKRIVLIDGDDLTKLMVRYNVGCRVEEILHLSKVDEDFFTE